MRTRKFLYICLALVCGLYVIAAVVVKFAPLPGWLGVGPATDSKALRKEVLRQKQEARNREGARMKDATRKKIEELEVKLARMEARERAQSNSASAETMSLISNLVSMISGVLSCLFAWLAYRTQVRPGGMHQSIN